MDHGIAVNCVLLMGEQMRTSMAGVYIYLDAVDHKFHCMCCTMLRNGDGVNKPWDDFLLIDPEEVVQHVIDHRTYGDDAWATKEQCKRAIQQWNVEARHAPHTPHVLERG